MLWRVIAAAKQLFAHHFARLATARRSRMQRSFASLAP